MLHYFCLAEYLDYFAEETAVPAVKSFLHIPSLKFIYSFLFWVVPFFFFQIPIIILRRILLLCFCIDLQFSSILVLSKWWSFLSFHRKRVILPLPFTCVHVPIPSTSCKFSLNNYALSYLVFQSIFSHNFLPSLKHAKNILYPIYIVLSLVFTTTNILTLYLWLILFHIYSASCNLSRANSKHSF